MDAPRVAVVIPCYEDGVLAQQAVRSLDGQEPCEVVVVDDGSTGTQTLQALEELERSGVRVVHQANAGPSAARNAGVAATTAPYVFPLDADDLLFPGALTTLADVLDADPRTAVAWGTALPFGGGLPGDRRTCLKVRALDPWRITYLNEIPGAALVRRSALQEAGGWRDGTGYEDWDLWMALAERGHGGRGLDVPVQRYRLGDARRWSTAHRAHGSVYDELRRSHSDLFARRRVTWRQSPAPWTAKLALPLLEALPLSRRDRWRAAHLLLHPRQVYRDSVARRLRQRRASHAES